LKRLLDSWDRNGSKSGPTPRQIEDDDDDGDDNDGGGDDDDDDDDNDDDDLYQYIYNIYIYKTCKTFEIPENNVFSDSQHIHKFYK
jgi:hypothetical protein